MLGDSNAIFGARGLYEREQAEFQIREWKRATKLGGSTKDTICLGFI